MLFSIRDIEEFARYVIAAVICQMKLRVHCFGLSLDGYGAGSDQDVENPLGVGGTSLFEWASRTRTFHQMRGDEGGESGIDDDFMARGIDDVGAWIIGRNMFGPIRGPWLDDAWEGWWGDDPPFHTPVFVLTHYPRPPIVMSGGTTFYFITSGPDDALRQAAAAANGRDVRLGGGVATIRQYLGAGLIDEMHLAISPVLLGKGEHLFDGIDLPALGYRCSKHASSSRATHAVIRRQP